MKALLIIAAPVLSVVAQVAAILLLLWAWVRFFWAELRLEG